MIESIQVTNYRDESVTMTLRSPEQSGFLVKDIDGLGPVKSTINFTEVLTLDGGIYNSSRTTFRNILMTIAFLRTTTETIEDLRQKSYKYFPLKRLLLLKIVTDNRVLYTYGYVESNEPNIFSKQEETLISILCPSAYLTSYTAISIDSSGVTGLFEFPFSNESLSTPLLEFSDLLLDDTDIIVDYEGDTVTGFTTSINFTGAVTGFSIGNDTLSQVMSFDDTALASILGSGLTTGDIMTIVTTNGSKAITVTRGGTDYNVLNALEAGSEWLNLERGTNEITISVSTGDGNFYFSLDYQPLYEGI